MKITRILMAFLITLILVGVLSGCTTDNSLSSGTEITKNLQDIHNEYFDVRVVENLGGGNLIVIDTNTNVMYLFVRGFYTATMTPIYNDDGTVKLYED